MQQSRFNYLYEFSSKGLEKPDQFKQHADRAITEILTKQNRHLDIKLHVEPEAKKRKVYKLIMSSKFMGKDVVLQKTGRNVYSLLKSLKKKFIRSCNSISRHKYKKNRKELVHHNQPLTLDEAI